MPLSIRSKFIGILFIAAVLPLGIAIIAIHVLGYHDYKRESGRLFQTVATHLAVTLDQSVDQQIEKLSNWMALVHLGTLLPPQAAPPDRSDTAAVRPGSVALESAWAGLGPGSPEVQAVLTNDLAQALQQFQAINPLLAEIQVTNAQGELVAATRKPARHWYGDQVWWQRTIRVRPGTVYLEGIAFDASAGVYVLDVGLPIRPGGRPSGAPTGVVHAVLNASRLFSSTPRILAEGGQSRQVILADGQVLFDLTRQQSPPVGERIAPAAVALVTALAPGWTTARLDSRSPRLVGHAPLSLGRAFLDDTVPPGLASLFVIIHDDAASVLAPVRKQLWLIAGAGVLILLLFAQTGLYIATRKILRPIQLLRPAAQTIAASAKLNEAAPAINPVVMSPHAAQVLEAIQRIPPGDEIADLAHDFHAMARRVLSYHERLEEQIAAKTAEIQSDLQVAREFQEALMPRTYPEIPTRGMPDPLRLKFHHVYKPASSVGGDFFDVRKLSDHRAGIFIADVMGHGARAALVTAILRTLLQDLIGEAHDPARLLGLINRHFYAITSAESQGLFVSALYLIIDTETALATYAAAGHPSPLIASRPAKTVTPLFGPVANNPALGLFGDSLYASLTVPLHDGDTIVLFTDGLPEASNSAGEEFGLDRLRAAIEHDIDAEPTRLSEAIVTAARQFSQPVAFADDVCVVVVEVGPA